MNVPFSLAESWRESWRRGGGFPGPTLACVADVARFCARVPWPQPGRTLEITRLCQAWARFFKLFFQQAPCPAGSCMVVCHCTSLDCSRHSLTLYTVADYMWKGTSKTHQSLSGAAQEASISFHRRDRQPKGRTSTSAKQTYHVAPCAIHGCTNCERNSWCL